MASNKWVLALLILPITLALPLRDGFAQVSLIQTPIFTYQGKLTENAAPASGAYQMQFKLFDSLSSGAQVGSTIPDLPVTVTDGVFTVQLNFGASAFEPNANNGANRWLEIGVRHNAGESYSTLTPREQITSSPFALRTLSASLADGLSARCVQCIGDANVNAVGASKVTGLGSYAILNSSQSQNGTFNITGNGLIGGNVGIGTQSPTATLDVRGHLALDANGSPILFTSATAGEKNNWLGLVNSPQTQTASALKAGGILVADNYNYAMPGKNDLIVKGKVGIGGAPNGASALQIAGNASQGAADSGLMKFGLLVNDDATLALCYNASNPASCGVTATTDFATGSFFITFPQQINNRIFSVTPAYSDATYFFYPLVYMARPTSQNTLKVQFHSADGVLNPAAAFYLLVF